MARHYTPLRYPGGKQKVAPFIAELIEVNGLAGCDYVEPYAGGAGVALDLLFSGMASKIHLNDACTSLYAFWWSVLNATDEFCRRITEIPLTVEEWRRQRDILRHEREHSPLEVGFSFFYLNRCNRSGILLAGPIGGFQQTGEWKIDARFPRAELIRRIGMIGEKRNSIIVKNMDAERFVIDYIRALPRKTLVYCDPPYFKQANRLYLNHYNPSDHERIARLIQKRINRPWVTSYDSAPEIIGYYRDRRQFCYSLQYNAGLAYRGTEVFFFSDKLNLPQDSRISSIARALRQHHRDARA